MKIDLAEALKRFPLPEGVPDSALNKSEVTAFFGCSPTSVDNWIREGMPCVSEGTNGRAWEFRASQVYAWRQAQLAAEETRDSEAQAAIQAMRLALIGGKAGDSIRALSPRERKEIYEIELAHRRLMAESRQLIPRQEVAEGLDDLLSLFRDAVTGLADRLEREANLDARQVDCASQCGDELLYQLHKKVEDFFNSRPEEHRLKTDLFNQ